MAQRVNGARFMRILWYWPHPQQVLNPAAEPLLRAGDSLVVQCLATYQGQRGDDPRVEFRRELPLSPGLRRFPAVARRVLRNESYVRRAVLRERLVRGNKFDVCHVETPNYLTDALALTRIRRLVPLVLVVHDVVPHEERLPDSIERRLLHRVYRSADVYVVLHEVIGARLTNDFGVDPADVVVGEHPLTSVDAPTAPGLLERAGGAPTPVNVLFFGTFRHDKGLPVLLDAAHRLKGEVGVQIHVAGGGEHSLERMVSDAAAGGIVTAEIGRVSASRKDELFRSADVVVLPYGDAQRFQSQSGVLADAYAYCRPVLVTDVGALGATVRSDATGWVVPPGDAAALAHELRLLASRVEPRRAATAAIDAVRHRYSYDSYGLTLRRAYVRARQARGLETDEAKAP